jgi:hypothetical protein
MGTVPGGGDTEGEGRNARFHVGSNSAPSWGFVGNERRSCRWHLWLR